MKEQVNISSAESVKPAGVFTVELTDAETGETVERQKRENFVQQRTLDAIAQFAAYLPAGLRTFSISGSSLFDTVMLTDYAGAPEPETENYIQGNRSAYGQLNEPATGIDRGAYNANESVFRSDYVKMVFDFATSQGNGTFQSIYTKEMISSISYSAGFALLTGLDFPFTWNRAAKFENTLYFWMTNGEKLYKVSEFDLKLIGNLINTPYEEFTFTSAIGSYATIKGNEIYRLSGSGNKTVEKATIDPVSTFTTVFTAEFNLSGIAYHEPTNRFYLEKSASADYVVYMYDANFTLIEVLDTGKERSGLIRVTDDGKFIQKNQYLYEIATGVITILGYSTNSSYHHVNIVDFGPYSISDTYYGDTQIRSAPQFYSRALLDQPVTKTSQQNMKITYEFNIPTLRIFGPPSV